MKKVLIPIITATLLACGSAVADVGSPGPCAAGKRQIAAPHGTGAAVRGLKAGTLRHSGPDCTLLVQSQFTAGSQKFLSDKELERALKRQLRGRLIDAKLNAARVEYTVLWEEQQAGKRKLRKLIVDAKTGKVKREVRGSS